MRPLNFLLKIKMIIWDKISRINELMFIYLYFQKDYVCALKTSTGSELSSSNIKLFYILCFEVYYDINKTCKYIH